MYLYTCRFCGDEMFTDAHKNKLIDGCYYEVETKNVTVSNDIDPSLLGANAAQDGTEEDESVVSSATSGLDVVVYNKLQNFPLEKKAFQSYFKGYLKRIIDAKKEDGATEDEIKEWQGNMLKLFTKIKDNFSDYEFYVGESFDTKATYGILWWKTDNDAVMIFVKDGLKETKQ